MRSYPDGSAGAAQTVFACFDEDVFVHMKLPLKSATCAFTRLA